MNVRPTVSPEEILNVERLPLTLTVAQAAKLVGVSRPTMYRAIEEDEFPHLKVRGRLMVPTNRLLDLLYTDQQTD